MVRYYFNTDVHAQPTLKDDGTVDYFHLNMINPCRKGQLLAEIIPEDEGEYGITVQGAKIRPRQVKKAHLEFGHNIEISEDRKKLTSLVDGHVSLVEGKVFVSDVYEVETVDLSTGNIEFDQGRWQCDHKRCGRGCLHRGRRKHYHCPWYERYGKR